MPEFEKSLGPVQEKTEVLLVNNAKYTGQWTISNNPKVSEKRQGRGI